MNTVAKSEHTFLYWKSRAENVVHTWPLMKHSNEALTVVGVYLVFVLLIGPAFMKNRKPYDLKGTIFFYNVGQVIFSAFLIYKALNIGIPFFDLLSPICHHKQETDTAYRTLLHSTEWWYVIAKVSEMAETVFFILRKKYSQVSLLHVYHHLSTFLFAWFLLKVAPEEQSLIVMALNSFVHVLMYSYYALSILGPQFQKYLWWKKHMTEFQMIQFIIYIIYFTLAKFSNCGYSNVITNTLLINSIILLGLFTHFYVGSYKRKLKE